MTHKTSRINPSAPIDEATTSNSRFVSCACTSFSVCSGSRSSSFATRTSPCMRRSTLRNVWTASKSRCERRRWQRALMKMLSPSIDTSARISRSSAAGVSVLTYAKRDSSNLMTLSSTGIHQHGIQRRLGRRNAQSPSGSSETSRL